MIGQIVALAALTSSGYELTVPVGYEAGSVPEPVWTLWGVGENLLILPGIETCTLSVFVWKG
jgi:hypothetical protein